MTTSYTGSNLLPLSALPNTSGVVQSFLVNVTNSGPATYAPDSLAASPIFGLGGQALQGNEMVANGVATLISYVGPLLNSGVLSWVLLECTGGAQQVGTGTGSQQASTVGQVQAGTLVSATAGGAVNALTASVASTLTSLSNGQAFTIIAAAANTGAATLALSLGSTALSALPIVKGNNQALVAGDIPGSGYPVELNFSTVYGSFVMQNPGSGINNAGGQVRGSFSNLRSSATGTNANIVVTADQLSVQSSSGVYKTLAGVSVTINTSSTGKNGLSTGTLAASTGYFTYIGFDGTNACGWIDPSATVPTVPAGITYWTRTGWIYTDGTANKFPYSYAQAGRTFQYQPKAGTNLSHNRALISGAQGDPAVPTYVAATTVGFIPSTSTSIKVRGAAGLSGAIAETIAAPNNSYGPAGVSTGYEPPINVTTPVGIGNSQDAQFILESNSVYYASSSTTGGGLYCIGWEDSF